MSYADDLLIILTSYHGGYRLMRQRMVGHMGPVYPYHQKQEARETKDNTLRITLSRLKKRGLVQNNNKIWKITRKGRRYLKAKLSQKLGIHFRYPFSLQNKRKNMIIAFDVPERYRRKRDWLRIELINLGFSPLQKSVWFGHAPLPQEFIKSLDDLDLIRFIKFFEAIKKDLV